MKLLYLPFLLGSTLAAASASANTTTVNVKDVVDVNTNPDIPQQIVGGNGTDGPVGYHVGLGYAADDSNYPECGGSLIAPRVVLTAAHCVDGRDLPLPTKVLVNMYNVTVDEGVEKVSLNPVVGENIIYRDDYSVLYEGNDIALIFLPCGVTPDGGFAKLNEDANKPVKDEELRLTGWGYTTGGGEGSDILLEAQLNYMTNEDCQDSPIFQESATIIDSMLCAAKEEKGACLGDSGGPLMLADVQVGIVSFGNRTCQKGAPTVYTRVSNYVDWIKDTVCKNLTDGTGDLCPTGGTGELCSTPSPTTSPTTRSTTSPTTRSTPSPTPAPKSKRVQIQGDLSKASKSKASKSKQAKR